MGQEGNYALTKVFFQEEERNFKSCEKVSKWGDIKKIRLFKKTIQVVFSLIRYGLVNHVTKGFVKVGHRLCDGFVNK